MKMESNDEMIIEKALINIAENSDMIARINEYSAEIRELLEKRKLQPSRIRIEQMPAQERYNKLKHESKKLKNAIIMLVYRAESALYGILTEYYKNASKDGRVILQEIFTSDADLVPDYKNKSLIIRLHSLSTPRANEAVKKLCQFLNQTETYYPFTNLKLIYETVAV